MFQNSASLNRSPHPGNRCDTEIKQHFSNERRPQFAIELSTVFKNWDLSLHSFCPLNSVIQAA